MIDSNIMISKYIEESIALQRRLIKDKTFEKKFTKVVEVTLTTFITGNKVMVAGNGGSAADSQHFTAEFVGKYKMVRRPYAAIALTTDTSMLTAWSNDVTFDTVFERQVEALGKPGDMFFGISTSGNSKNILKALAKAKKMGIFTVALLGGNGGRARGMADLEFVIPSKNTPRIQEMHTLLLHSIAEEVEKRHYKTHHE
jgi:D-sedoheptulose 7-phosphate isomerase